MIEQAPKIEKTDQTIPLMVKFQMNGSLKKIKYNEEYNYFDYYILFIFKKIRKEFLRKLWMTKNMKK